MHRTGEVQKIQSEQSVQKRIVLRMQTKANSARNANNAKMQRLEKGKN